MRILKNLLCILAALSIVGCASVQELSPSAAVSKTLLPKPSKLLVVKPFSDGENWMVSQDMLYQIKLTSDASSDEIIIPAGFVTDFASVPSIFWPLGVSPYGKYNKAAVVHDFLYWTQVCTRQQADEIFYKAMIQDGVDALKAKSIYQAVRLGGGSAWSNNAKQKISGVIKILPTPYLAYIGLAKDYKNIPETASWSQYSEKLMTIKKKDPALKEPDAITKGWLSKSFCENGNAL